MLNGCGKNLQLEDNASTFLLGSQPRHTSRSICCSPANPVSNGKPMNPSAPASSKSRQLIVYWRLANTGMFPQLVLTLSTKNRAWMCNSPRMSVYIELPTAFENWTLAFVARRVNVAACVGVTNFQFFVPPSTNNDGDSNEKMRELSMGKQTFQHVYAWILCISPGWQQQAAFPFGCRGHCPLGIVCHRCWRQFMGKRLTFGDLKWSGESKSCYRKLKIGHLPAKPDPATTVRKKTRQRTTLVFMTRRHWDCVLCCVRN